MAIHVSFGDMKHRWGDQLPLCPIHVIESDTRSFYVALRLGSDGSGEITLNAEEAEVLGLLMLEAGRLARRLSQPMPND